LHALPTNPPTDKRKRYFRLRLAWIIILGILAVIVLGAVNEYIDFDREIAMLRRDLEAAELEQSLLITDALRPVVEQHDWQAAQSILERIAMRTLNTRLYLADTAGYLLTDGKNPQIILDHNDIKAISAGLTLTLWTSPNHTLRVLCPITGTHGEVLAVLVSDSSLEQQFLHLYSEKASRTASYFLSLMLALGIFLIACWRLFLSPLNEIYRLSRAITQGTRKVRASDIPVLELQRVNQAFNEMIEHLSDQQERLEETVAERTRELEESSAEIRSHNNLMGELIAQSEHLNRTVTPPEVINTIGEGALALSKADRLAIFFKSPNQGMACAWSRNLSEHIIEVSLSLISQFIDISESFEARPVLIGNIEQETEIARLRELARSGAFCAVSLWPLIYEGKAIAFVTCFYNRPMEWKSANLEILEAFFRQAAVSIENARLFESECAQRKLAEALRDIAATLNSTLDLNEVLDGIINSLGQVIPHDAVGIMLLEGEMIRPVRWHGIPPENAELFDTWHYSYRNLLNRQLMIETVQAAVIPDTTKDPHWVRTRGLEWVRSYAGAPICQRGEVTGFIDIMSARPNFFNDGVGIILQAFAVQAAVAMENARLYQHSQQRMAETNALFRAVQPLFQSAEDILALSQQITESVTQEFASAHCSILLVNKERTHIVLVAQSGSLLLTAPELPLDGPGLTVAAANSGNVIYSPDVTADKNYIAGAELSRCELAIPLLAEGQVIGVLNLESTQIDAFDERARRLMASFADRAALGLENARLFDTIRQNADEMTRLGEVAERRAQEAETLRLAAASVNSTLDLQTVLDRILKHLDQVIPHDSACIFLIEGEQNVRAGAVKSVARTEEVFHQSFPRNDALLLEIEKTMRPVVLQDAQQEPRFHGWGGTSSVHGWMGLPLTSANEFVGALTLDRHTYDIFQPDEIELAQAFANQAAAAVQNARLYHATQQRARELEALHAATNTLVSTLDLQKLLERILAAASSAIPATEAAALHLLDENHDLCLRVEQSIGQNHISCLEWNDENGPWTRVIKQRKPLLIVPENMLLEETNASQPRYCWDGRSLMITPLILEDKPLGAITLISAAQETFSEQELYLLISFANTATAAIHNAQLHGAVQYLAITDPLTGIYNRRGFFELANRLIEQSLLNERPTAAIMIDIDFFKRINDSYGHDAGDIVLRTLADRCRKVLRDSDLICRYGGEEFTILLADSDMTGAQNAANRIFHSITDFPMETRSGPVSITISVGIAMFGGPCGTLDKLLKCADQALYLAKEKGRNQVCVWNG